MAIEIKQRKICGDCRCYSRTTNSCTIGYDTKYKHSHSVFSSIIDAIPLEPCPKPLTVADYMEAIKHYRK